MKILTLSLLITTAVPAFATMPVIDYTQIARSTKMIGQLQNQYKTLKDQYDTMNAQYGQMKKQYDSITGNYGWGNLKNSADDLKNDREWAASDWQSALKGLSGGNPQRYHELLSQYQQQNSQSIVSKKIYEKGSDSVLSESYDNQVKTNQASSTQASYEFNDINTHLQDLHELTAAIEDAEKNHDLKSAMDLNSRIGAEMGFVQVELLRMMTVLNQQVAQIQSTQINQQKQVSEFNSAGEEAA